MYFFYFQLLETKHIRVLSIPIYRYKLIGIGKETLQTETDSWRLIHTDADTD